jgi:hypothetical protein
MKRLRTRDLIKKITKTYKYYLAGTYKYCLARLEKQSSP